MAELIVKDVALRLGDNEILKGVSLAVPAGEVVALLGPSGSGKTTLLRAVAGLETPHRGSIAIGDRVFFDAARGIDLPAEERGLGLVFQSYALWPHRTVFDNVAYGLKLRGVSAEEIKRRVEKTLSQIGLGHLAARYPHQLSGGQQQRVAIARALVYEPPVILLDEPLSNLDAKLREEARAWLRTLIVTLGLSAIHVTHDQVEAMAIADKIVLLDTGLIAQEGPPTALYNEPGKLFSAEFMGSNNRLEGKLVENSGGKATIEVMGERLTGLSRTKAAAGEKATGVIRIERVHCASSPGPNRVKMELKAPMYLGERWELVFARDNITVRAYASAPLEPGEHFVEFPTDALWVF
ncbi:MAG TPA: ABC transporter ATP-binding protein [Bradyrhizobium sp.]|jgi:iron(III) transport system ATP-binding protein|nr:ABC transporter ATP-binding protein [Bradyrhizobium sp.]